MFSIEKRSSRCLIVQSADHRNFELDANIFEGNACKTRVYVSVSEYKFGEVSTDRDIIECGFKCDNRREFWYEKWCDCRARYVLISRGSLCGNARATCFELHWRVGVPTLGYIILSFPVYVADPAVQHFVQFVPVALEYRWFCWPV